MDTGGEFARLVTAVGEEAGPRPTLQVGERLSLDRVHHQFWWFFWRVGLWVETIYQGLSKEAQRLVTRQLGRRDLRTRGRINFGKVRFECDRKLSRFMRGQFATPPHHLLRMTGQPPRYTLRSSVGVSDTCDYHTALRHLNNVARTLCVILESIHQHSLIE